MSIYECIPVNEQFERFNLSMLSNSPMPEGIVNPMFLSKLILTILVCILMIKIGSSPVRIQNTVKHVKYKSHPTGTIGHMQGKSPTSYTTQVKGRRGERAPVSWLLSNRSCSNFANWPNSAGMGPVVYKTQSKHTINKSPYPTGTKGHEKSKPIP
jgi:hypothetical protein